MVTRSALATPGRCRDSGEKHANACSGGLESRKPMLLLRLPVSLLLRLADRAFSALLFHEPPRCTRWPRQVESLGQCERAFYFPVLRLP